ncbi:MAG TPA: phosphotransferase [Caulobacterales bacterium]|nr:phosphotransferase [Caulobacterales bacterium]
MRSEALASLLKETGFAAAARLPLAGDASTRRYERLVLGSRKAVLMDAPPSAESPPCPPGATPAQRRALGWNATARLAASRVEAFVAVGSYLRSIGLSAPEIYGVHVAAGYAVIEDLGDELFARAVPEGADEIYLYETAARVLAHVHAQTPPLRLEGPESCSWPLLDYDALALEVNLDLFAEWTPRAADVRIDDKARVRWEHIRNDLVEKALGFPRAFTIRDYHAENLLWLPDRPDLARVGLLDFQDAVRGWRAWDFAMLLQDARRDVSVFAREAAIQAYCIVSKSDEAAFRHELAVLGAINAMRIIGRFAQLAHDGKSKYAAFMPREWAHLAENLKHPALAEARAFVEEVAKPYLERAA